MTQGTLEALNANIETLNANMAALLRQNTSPSAGDSDGDAAPAKPAAKKVTAKKVAAKKVAAKRGKGAKAPDYSDIVDFKKAMFAVADGAGLEGDDALKKLREYFSTTDYASSDEVEVEDREQFVADLKTFMEGGEDAGENYDI